PFAGGLGVSAAHAPCSDRGAHLAVRLATAQVGRVHAPGSGGRLRRSMSADGLSAVVLAGTHHWSGSNFEQLAPRPLVPVALSPLISYPLRWLRDGGVLRAAICANGTTRALEAALGDGAALGIDLTHRQDSQPRGAAGCVRDAGMRYGSDTLLIADGT